MSAGCQSFREAGDRHSSPWHPRFVAEIPSWLGEKTYKGIACGFSPPSPRCLPSFPSMTQVEEFNDGRGRGVTLPA